MAYWLGIDAGTTAIKAGLYSADGVQVALGEAPSKVDVRTGGKSEQDMDGVWSSVCSAIRKAIDGIDPSQIESVGLCAQGDGLWALNNEKRPIGPAILWNDTRASTGISNLYETGRAKAISHACNTSIWPGTSGAIYQWLRQNAPATADQITHVTYCAGWVGLCLTGELATDFSDASIPFLDLTSKEYAPEALDALDARALQPTLSKPRSADSALGQITEEAAAATGLKAGTPVSVGTLDLSAMIVGMGMDQPGETMMILGTTAVVNILTETITPSDLPVGATAFHATAGLMTRILAPTTGAAAFDWFCALHPQTLGGETPSEIAQKLNALTQDVPPGANGVTFLPYLNGERAPFVAPEARGVFFGLSQSSTKADMGRAVMEGSAFSLRHCLIAEQGTLPDSPVRLTGGGARNALWCQIIADTMQTPIIVCTASDHGLWGAACLGASANGKGAACDLAKRTEDSLRYDPDPGLAAAYDTAFERYRHLSDSCRDIWKF